MKTTVKLIIVSIALLCGIGATEDTLAYGGGGGRSGSSVGICGGTGTPEFYDLQPYANQKISSLSEVEFIVTGKSLDAEKIYVNVDGEDLDIDTAEKANGDILVTADLGSEITKGKVNITIKVITKSGCIRNISFFVNVTGEGGGDDGTGSGSESVFKDISNHWAADVIAQLYEEGIVTGYDSTGMFGPNDSTNRAQMIAMGLRAFGVSVPTSVSAKPFPDVATNQWHATYITKGKDKSFVEGYPDGNYKPARSVTRAEALKIILRVAGIDTSSTKAINVFSDVKGTDWYAPYVSWAVNNGVIEGYSDGTFRPNRPITRAEISKVVLKVMEALGLF